MATIVRAIVESIEFNRHAVADTAVADIATASA
jgi:hypothetical protein